MCICLWAMWVLRRGWGEVEGWSPSHYSSTLSCIYTNTNIFSCQCKLVRWSNELFFLEIWSVLQMQVGKMKATLCQQQTDGHRPPSNWACSWRIRQYWCQLLGLEAIVSILLPRKRDSSDCCCFVVSSPLDDCSEPRWPRDRVQQYTSCSVKQARTRSWIFLYFPNVDLLLSVRRLVNRAVLGFLN